ncbi:hypothetical protein QAD02_009018 [Eretmocerus hayati]|uniref:Uncharacterized protein n=1 Tax=Eretmocerus hayati TaxID=131215 RepID=A0ACC2N8G5_9HYME|nr:hypothetical protein QAD02_009018 [Eretmocerus hayati]
MINFSTTLAFILLIMADGPEAAETDGSSPRILLKNVSYVSIRINGTHHCMGSMISNRHVLVPAHCTQGTSAEKIQVVVRSTNFMDHSNITITEDCYNVTSAAYASKYVQDGPKYNDDIAVLLLNGHFEKLKGTKSLTIKERIPEGERFDITIYGFDENYDLVADFPRLVNSTSCNESYKHWGGITSGQMCAISEHKMCNSDAGSALLVQNDLFAIMSYSGDDCTDIDPKPKYPTVFTAVRNHFSWISKMVDLMDKSRVVPSKE